MSQRRHLHLRRLLLTGVALPLLMMAGAAHALPGGGVVTGTSGGTATITTGTNTVGVATVAHRTLIDWSSFSVGSGETVNFTMPDKDAIVVNRQLTGGSSQISGAINSGYVTGSINGVPITSVGGNIWIINPNGVFFNSGAAVNVGGLLATTADLVSDSGFLNAKDADPISFSTTSSYTGITIAKGASITVNDGTAAFIADTISVSGSVKAAGAFQNDSKAVYATAKSYTIRFSSNAPDPLRATDLALFDLVVTVGGNNLNYTDGASTTAGQVILDDTTDLAELGTNTGDWTNTISGGTITATGKRGDGYDLLLMSDNFTSGAPFGGTLTSRSALNIGRANTSTPAPVITSAGGLYMNGDYVNIGGLSAATDVGANFNIAGAETIYAKGVELENMGGQLKPDITSVPNAVSYFQNGVYVQDNLGSTNLGTVSTTGYVNIISEGLVTAGAINGSTSVNIEGAGLVKVGAVTSTKGSLSLASEGSVSTGALSGTSIFVSAGQSFRINSGDTPAPVANSSISIAGPVTGTAATGYVELTASGGVTVSGAIQVQGEADIDANGAISLASVDAAGGELTVLAGGAITSGALTAPQIVTFAGDNMVNAQGVATIVDPAAVMTVNGPVTIMGAGLASHLEGLAGLSITGPIISAGSLKLDAGGALSIGTVTAQGDVDISADGAVKSGSIFSSTGALDLESEQALSTGALSGASVIAQAGTNTNDFNTTGGTANAVLIVGGPITSSKGGVLATATGDLNVTGGIMSSADVLTQSGGSTTIGAVSSSGGAVQLYAAGNLTTGALSGGSVDAEASYSFSGTNPINAGSGPATAALSNTTLTVNGSVTTTSGDAGLIDFGSGGGSISINGPVNSAGSANIVTEGALKVADVNAVGDIDLSSVGDISTGALTSQTADIDVFTQGAIKTGNVIALDNIYLDTAGGVSAGAMTNQNGFIYIDAGGPVTVGVVTGDSDPNGAGLIQLDSESSLTTGALKAASVQASAGLTDEFAGSVPPITPNSTLTINGAVTATSTTDRNYPNPSGAVLELQATGALTVTGAISSAGSVFITGGQTVALGSVIAGQTPLAATDGSQPFNGRSLFIEAAGALTTGAISGADVQAGAGGAVSFYSFSGASGSAAATMGANLTISGPVTASNGVSLGASGVLTAGAISAGAGEIDLASSGGSVSTGALTTQSAVYVESFASTTLGGVSADTLEIEAGQVVTISPRVGERAPGLASDTAPTSISYNPGADISLNGPVNLKTSGDFEATGVFRNTAPITVSASAGAGSFVVESNDVDIQAAITVIDAGTAKSSLVLESRNASGVALGDNLANASGFYSLSAKEYSMLTVDTVAINVVDDLGRAASSVFRIGDLTVDASKTPRLLVGEVDDTSETTPSPSESILSVEGTVLGVGAPSFGNQAPGPGAWAPDAIIVSGAIGTAASPFGQVSLYANTAVLLGSNAFVADFDKVTDLTTLKSDQYVAGFGGVAPGHAFIDTGALTLSAPSAIVGQNTALTGGGLIATTTLTLSGNPGRIDLFGQVDDGKGALSSGSAVAASSAILVTPLAPDTNQPTTTQPYRINGCVIGDASNCQPTGVTAVSDIFPQTILQFLQPPSTASSDMSQPGALVILPSVRFDLGGRKKRRGDLTSGVANEDLWPVVTQ